jgi:hypothetical protein
VNDNAKTRFIVAYMDHDHDGATSREFFAKALAKGLKQEEGGKDVNWREDLDEDDYYGDVHIRVMVV